MLPIQEGSLYFNDSDKYILLNRWPKHRATLTLTPALKALTNNYVSDVLSSLAAELVGSTYAGRMPYAPLTASSYLYPTLDLIPAQIYDPLYN